MIWVGIVLFVLPALLVLVCIEWAIVGDGEGTATACLVLALVGLAAGVYTGQLGQRRRRRIG